MTRTEGFDASRPFLEVVPNTPGMRIQVDNPATDPARAKLALQAQPDRSRAPLLGLTGGTQPGFTATYAYGGQAESPDGKADIIDVTGPDDFKARLFVDAETHLPLMLTYMEPEARVVMRTMTRDGGRGGGATPVAAPGGASHGSGAAPARQSAVAPAPRQRRTPAIAGLTPERARGTRQADEGRRGRRRRSSWSTGCSSPTTARWTASRFPYRIARGLGAKTIEEWDVTSYKVNPSFKADRFKVGS